jgi:hypothetical protein
LGDVPSVEEFARLAFGDVEIGPRRESLAYFDRLMQECFRGGLKSPHVVQEAVNEATLLSLVSCRLGVVFVSSATRWRCPASVVVLPVTDLTLSLLLALSRCAFCVRVQQMNLCPSGFICG